MFLHSGASLHGHEYSARQSPQQNPRRLPFIRSALRHPSDADTRTTPATVSSPSPGPPSRPQSYHEYAPTEPQTTRPRPTSEYMPPRRELSVRFREPETDNELPPLETPQSDDEGSGALSDASEVSDCSTTTRKRMKRKRTPRKSTRFLLAHPAPRIGPKQRKLAPARPRLLLQLQDLTDKRPNPAFDVVPSSLVIGSMMMPKLARKCPGLFRAKPMLGLNDLLLVRSEDYDAPTAPGSPEPEDCLDQRDVIAIISPLLHMGPNACEIVMEDGSTWEASLMANGSYEFIGVDERGRISTARWVKKAVLSFSTPVRVGSSITTPPSSPAPLDSKWTFSMIHPDTRRHPIMGTLLSNTLDVFETYNTMSASSGRYPPTRPTGMDPAGTPDWLANGITRSEGRITMAVPEDVKLLMVASAAWLHLRQEGWPATAVSRPPPATLQRRTLSNSFPQKTQTLPMRNSIAIPPTHHNPPQPTPSPAPSLRDFPSQESPAGRRRSMSSTSFVKRFVVPRVSEEGRRPTVENIYIEADKADKADRTDRAERVEKPEKVDKPPSRRMSVRQIANKIFRRKSVSQAQTDEHFYKLEY